jgi:L-fucose mutarotase
MPLFELDTYVSSPVVMMAPVKGDSLNPDVERSYLEKIKKEAPEVTSVQRIDRFAFYERTKSAFAVVMTGETAKYGNVLLKKGVTPVNQ